ncbi:hypothetical protein KDL45_09080 [bacterium]|nr:hypothetical protein [bacterium]
MKRNRTIAIAIFAVLALYVASAITANRYAGRIWAETPPIADPLADVSEPVFASTPSDDTALPLGNRRIWMAEDVGPYKLAAAYPEELTLLYRAANGDEVIVQYTTHLVTERIRVLSESLTTWLVRDGASGARSLYDSAGVDHGAKFGWNPLAALRRPFLYRVKAMALKGPGGARPRSMQARTQDGIRQVWRTFLEPEHPNRFYGITKFRGADVVDLNVVFRPVPSDADELAGTFAATIELSSGDVEGWESAVSGCVASPESMTPDCQAISTAALLENPPAMEPARALLKAYEQARDEKGGLALLDFFRPERPLNREVREFCESVEAVFPQLRR